MPQATVNATRTYNIEVDYPELWEMCKEIDNKGKMGFSTTAREQELEALMHEVWLARSNRYDEHVKLHEQANEAVPPLYGIIHNNAHMQRC